MFPGHVISRRGDIAWPSRSSDLSAPYYFLWRHLQAKVYVNKPRALGALKQNIMDEIKANDKGLMRSGTLIF
jgi:hypothetical protein